MLEFLVTSKARRRLLQFLWAEDGAGSMLALAERVHVGYANAWREIHAMQELGLVSSAREAGVEVFRANNTHPFAATMRALVAQPTTTSDEESRRIRNQLFSLGAPIFGTEVPVPDVEEALVRGVQLAHHDGTVASILPICFYQQRGVIKVERLVRHARILREKRALGFFLDMTTVLSSDKRFSKWGERVRDRRCTGTVYFFTNERHSALSRQIAERNTPDVARSWGWRMNMGLDAFEAMFEKHVLGKSRS